MNEEVKSLLMSIKKMNQEIALIGAAPEEGLIPQTQQVIPHSLVRGTRGYVEKIVYQINGSYQNGWYDACAVMVRRLLETLIIEVYEKNGISDKIKDKNGDFFYLGDLIANFLSETKWNVGRNTKKVLPRLKDIGDWSAHNRRFVAHKQDIDKLLPDLRVAIQELIFLAELKK
ncbi:MAG: DUF4145 domain-containing protein [Roseiflexaceae bacterium]|nr:DUF4145 domain-containing protein [Roseiflexaceae bacterium]